ncbi:heme-degrading domain-containing protein [Paenibacillus sp. NPDC058071]|uniref:heme-degrading domain-containing protein n=1 Tax=Paenibacillus sp. NPDC058071 TaxID=3346326 RepID=UPI0036DBDF86
MSETLNELLKQEEELQFPSFTNEDALRLGLLIIETAKAEFDKGIAVHIENDKHPLFTHFMQGTDDGNVYWINAKKNVVNRFGNSSLYVGESYKAKGTTFKESAGLPEEEYQGEGGSFPLIVRGQGKVGTVTVTGLQGEQDHYLAVEGIRKFLQL